MTFYSVSNPFMQVFNLAGTGLNAGDVYFGVAGQDPETNPIPVYWDVDGMDEAAQPIPTTGGYLYRNGSPAAVFLSTGTPVYSIKILDKNGSEIYYQANVQDLIGSILGPDGANYIKFSHAETYDPGTIGNHAANSVWVTDAPFNATGDGVTNDAAAFQAASNFLSSGGEILVPEGTFLVSTSVTLGDNVKIRGVGPTSILKGGVTSFITASGKANVGLKNLKVLNNSYRVYFVNSTVQMQDVWGDGTHSSTNITNQGFWFSGCSRVLIDNPQLVDYRDALYFDTNSSTPCGVVNINGGQIEQTKHGSGANFPTGVYDVDVQYMYVDGTIFKNIKPSSDASNPAATGYGFYEGDGTDGNLLLAKLDDVKFIDDDGYTTYPMNGCLITKAKIGRVDSALFKGPSGGSFLGFRYGARNQVVSNSTFDAAQLVFDRQTGITHEMAISSGNTFQNITGPVLRVGPTGSGLKVFKSVGDTFRNCTYGAITMIFVDFFDIDNPTVIECNTSGQTSDAYRAGINADGPTTGRVRGGSFVNGTGGQMQYGVNAAALNNIQVSGSYYSGMTVANTRNVIVADYDQGTFTPTIVGSGTAGTAAGTFTGIYTRVGRLVTCQIRVNWTAGTGVGNLLIGGLPFTSGATHYGAAAYGWFGDVTLTASNVATAYVAPGSTQVTIYQYPVAGGAITAVPYKAAGNITLTVIYST